MRSMPKGVKTWLIQAMLILPCAVFSVVSWPQTGDIVQGPLSFDQPAECVTPAERGRIRQKIAEFEASEAFQPSTSNEPKTYTFFPLAGTLYGDLFNNNYVDLDPSSGLLDWDCSAITYDGHTAIDTDLRGFGEQSVGVPIFAGLDGTVADAHDGEEDNHTGPSSVPPNQVLLNHGGTHYTWYVHMKKGSVAVQVGQHVVAGTQIGLAGSSGNSTQPHLHFESRFNGSYYEPYAGSCRSGESYWLHQVPIRRDTYLRDFQVTNVDVGDYPPWPHDIPRTGSFVQGTKLVSFRVLLHNLPASSTYRIRIKNPSGSVVADWPGSFGNASPSRNPVQWWHFNWTFNQTGTWKIVFDVNDQTLGEAPFTVVASTSEIHNRPPNPIQGAVFEPSAPREGDVVLCRVQTPWICTDPDYDIVRYCYQWSVNGQQVREVTSAATSDVIRRDLIKAGDTVRCVVTPTDGTDSAPSVTVEASVANPMVVQASAQPPSGQAPVTVALSATVTGGAPPYSYEWDFGDGETGSGESVQHVFSTVGQYPITLDVRDSLGWLVQDTSLTVTATLLPPPAATSLKKLGSPFRLHVSGSGFQDSIRVFINGSEWTNLTCDNATQITLKGGKALKAAVPKNTPTQFRFLNPDGGESTATLKWP